MELATAIEQEHENDHISTGERALSRISVRPPYFALEDLIETGEGIVTAQVPAAPTAATEVGAMAADQVARHLAILGSCAAALRRPDDARHHYLATKAHYARLSNSPRETTGPLRAEAVASWVDRRTARALIKLTTADGHGLNILDVEYTVLAPKMFLRLNPPVDVPADGPVERGEADRGATVDELPFVVEQLETGLRVDCGPVPASLCAGHFPDYPAAPVAIVMGQLCRAAGLNLARHIGHSNVAYRVEEGHVTAQGLARAGQRLVLNARYVRPVPGGHQLIGTAEADGQVVGELMVTMSAHTPDPEPEPDSDSDSELESAVDDRC